MIVNRTNFDAAVEHLSLTGVYAFDTETTGLLETDRIFSMAFYDGKEGYYFNFQEYTGLDPDLTLPREWLQKMKKIFDNQESFWAIHNAKFDMRMLHYEGIEIKGQVTCTKALERVIFNNLIGRGAYSLDGCAKRRGMSKDDAVENYIAEHRLYDWESIPGKREPQKKKKFHLVPFSIISQYALMDAEVCFKIYTDQLEALENISKEGGHSAKIHHIAHNEIALTKTCFAMERHGIKIDRAYTEKALEHEKMQVEKLTHEFNSLTGIEFNDGRTCLAQAFTKIGAEMPLTDKGNPSFNADSLEALDSPIANLVLRIREHSKRANTYYSSFLLYADSNDIVHPDMNQSGTETGRFSYSNPNLQNVPKEEDEELEYYVRRCFVPHEGREFVSIDYKQQEFRMMIDYARARSLIDAVNSGMDVHEAAAAMMGVTRKQAKTIQFGLLYGMGVGKLARSLGISPADAKALKEAYFDKFPEIRQFLSQCQEHASRKGFITNWMGRRCYLADRSYAYIMPNHLIQGGCADIMKLSLNKIYHTIKTENLQEKIFPVLSVHDEILFSVHPNFLSVTERMQKIMENIYLPLCGIKLEVSTKLLPTSWSSRG